jgi:hypothetical protein
MSEYVIAKYIRLSVEDDKTESMSIPHQRLMLDRHIEELEIPNAKVIEFVDNGHSGTNMERPAVQEMLDLARSGGVNCICVKDFSRFSRNAMDSGYFIEQVFPLYQIRFISVTDNFDSNDHKNDTGGIDVAFKLLMHEYYSKDLSEKIKSAKRIQMARGENIVAGAIYGYRKNDTGNWEPDPGAAAVVREIYRMALDGISPAKIRDRLFEEKYPTPREYIDMKHGKDTIPQCLWATRAVVRTLTNEQYVGTYIAGKQVQKEIGSHRKIRTDKSEWITIPDSHPPIVDKEDFAQVQELMKGYLKTGVFAPQEKPSWLDEPRRRNASRMTTGKWIAATPLYGYLKSEQGKWLIDDKAAGAVRLIFDLAMNGVYSEEIKEKLRNDGYPTPKEQMNVNRGRSVTPECIWTAKSIRFILRNIQYTGAFVSGKVVMDFDTSKRYHTPEKDWIVIPGCHPPIISKDVFDETQEILNNRKLRIKERRVRDYMLKEKVFCGCCDYAMSYDPLNNPVYHCYHTRANPKADCHKMTVGAAELDEAVLTIIRKQAEAVLNTADLSQLRHKGGNNRHTADIEKQIRECVEQRQRDYERFTLRKVDRETYQKMKDDCSARIAALNNRLAILKQADRDKQSAQKSCALAREVLSESATPREIVKALIEKILVFPNNKIEILWKIADFANNDETREKIYV